MHYCIFMRTTLTIDDDVAAILERERKRKGLTFKEFVNAALRRGLEAEQAMPPTRKVVTRPHDFGFKAGVDLDKLNQLADELEAEAVAAGLRRQP
jgi:uncharacterized Fe-S cluster-containing radical SAM superfamily enzyme